MLIAVSVLGVECRTAATSSNITQVETEARDSSGWRYWRRGDVPVAQRGLLLSPAAVVSSSVRWDDR